MKNMYFKRSLFVRKNIYGTILSKCGYTYLCGAFNKFPDFFVQAFKIVVDSWEFSMLLLYIL